MRLEAVTGCEVRWRERRHWAWWLSRWHQCRNLDARHDGPHRCACGATCEQLGT